MRSRKGFESGFTLIELMIAVAILAIVIAIAVPAYTNYVTRTNRTDGHQLLSETAQALERCFTRFGSYTATNCAIGQSGGFPIDSENGWYSLEWTDQEIDATSFTLTAKPQGAQATRDQGKCDALTLSHRGERGQDGDGDRCWG